MQSFLVGDGSFGNVKSFGHVRISSCWPLFTPVDFQESLGPVTFPAAIFNRSFFPQATGSSWSRSSSPELDGVLEPGRRVIFRDRVRDNRIPKTEN